MFKTGASSKIKGIAVLLLFGEGSQENELWVSEFGFSLPRFYIRGPLEKSVNHLESWKTGFTVTLSGSLSEIGYTSDRLEIWPSAELWLATCH